MNTIFIKKNQVIYLIGSIGHVLRKNSLLNSAFSFWFVAHFEAPVAHTGATMRQLDTPVYESLSNLFITQGNSLPEGTLHLTHSFGIILWGSIVK